MSLEIPRPCRQSRAEKPIRWRINDNGPSVFTGLAGVLYQFRMASILPIRSLLEVSSGGLWNNSRHAAVVGPVLSVLM